MTKIIECPACGWNADGDAHWTCTCGHTWNTFDTKGKCPNCKIQWEETYCPICEEPSPHKDWYIETTKSSTNYTPEVLDLMRRKKNLEDRLVSLGITNYKIKHLPYLDFTKEKFQSPYESGCRLLILYGISYAIHNLDDREKIISWFKREKLWDKVSKKEKDLLNTKTLNEDALIELSWRMEAAIVLAWALNILDKINSIDIDVTDETMEDFVKNMPELGNPTKDFLSELKFRGLEEIYEENLLNELATTYFRDLMFNGKSDETKINRMISFERHYALNWLRKFSGIEEWDETDTST